MHCSILRASIAAFSIILTCVTAHAQTSACAAFEIERPLSSDLEQADHFGEAMAISGNVMVVGAPGEGTLGIWSGAAYVFRHNGISWVEEQKLTPSDGVFDQRFGFSVAIDGNVIAIGEEDQDCQGFVYVFRFNGATWNQEVKLSPSTASPCNRFGESIDVDGDLILVGAKQDDAIGGAFRTGSAFLFRFNGSQWVEEQKLRSSNPGPDDFFGTGVALQGDLAVVGAPRTQFGSASHFGSVYSFRLVGTTWTQEQELVPSDSHDNNQFGTSIAIDGNTLVVGTSEIGIPGSAYVYEHNGMFFGNEAILSASDGHSGSRFGNRVSLSGNAVVVGASWDSEQGTGAGAAYLFLRGGASTWVQTHKLLSTGATNGDHIGESVAVAGSLIVIGSASHNTIGSNSGSTFAYDLMSLPSCPATYCIAKIASPGCIPAIGFTGSPSVSSNGLFRIVATNVVNRKLGLMIYGTQPAASPFLGGTLCIGGALQRSSALSSFGNPASVNDCSGALAFNMQAWIQSGNDPSLVAGQQVFAQFWFRDGLSTFGAGLTDALSFVINP